MNIRLFTQVMPEIERLEVGSEGEYRGKYGSIESKGSRVRARTAGLVGILILLLPLIQSMNIAQAAAPKKGAICSTIGQTSGKGTAKLTCSPITSLRWIATPVKPAIGSIFAPAKQGQSVKVREFSFATKEIDFSIGTEICAENAFNEGCALGSKLEGIVDSNSEVRWIGINIEVTNSTFNAVTLSSSNFVFYLVQANNDLIENNIVAVVPNNLFELRIPAGEKSSGKIVFSVPKTVDALNPLLLMRDQSKSSVKDYYFLLDW